MSELGLGLPGFRFHPTEQELIDSYLRKMVFGKKLRFDIIGFLNIYHHDPWDLPGLAKNGEREWYFFVTRDRKHGNGGRPNRTTKNGFWKATGSDRAIRSLSDKKCIIGLKKTLVFYKGRAPRGCKTDWIMNEYRMPETCTPPKDIVLCKIYRKAMSLRELERRAAVEEDMKTPQAVSPSSTVDSLSFTEQQNLTTALMPINDTDFKIEEGENHEIEEEGEKENKDGSASSSLRVEFAKDKSLELQLPKVSLDWTQDLSWAQFISPWLGNWTPYANVLNL